ncbi:MAG: TonB-dependent receptor, partial [Opitutaceae bacterium]|nr:TonB-dependent receptor [Opitutaceae bacterium]
AVENEEGRGVEAGIKSALFDNKINFTLTAYDIRLKNVRVNNPESSINGGPDPDAPQYTLAGRQTSRGVEFDCNFDLGKSLTFFGAVGYVEAVISNAAEYDNNRQRARVPRANAGAGARWRPHSGPVKGLFVTGGVSYIGSSRYNNAMYDLVIPGYSLVSAGVGYDFSFNIKRKINNRMQVNINNLLNHQYVTNAASGGPRRAVQVSYRLGF